MFSVLIPVYNFDITRLAEDLLNQCKKESQEFEILCIDDCSKDEFKIKNRILKNHESLFYTELDQNIGRAKIRELLAEKAKFSNLLFLDCDVEIPNKNFISNYLQNQNSKVIIGGIAYHKKRPKNKEYTLRWLYGTIREQRSAVERKNSKFIHFLASNLWIERELFLSIPLQKEIQGYGHEDTWLGLQLTKQNIIIEHIENHVYHVGLDNSIEFLKKSLSGVHNLVQLYESGNAGKDLKLISVFEKIKQMKLLTIAQYVLHLRLKSTEDNLHSDHPQLGRFDEWKLYHFIRFYREK